MTLLVKSNLNLFWKYAFIVTFGYGPGYAFLGDFYGFNTALSSDRLCIIITSNL